MYARPTTNPSTRLFGAATAALMTLGVGYALILTTIATFVPDETKPIQFVSVEAPKAQPMDDPPTPNVVEDTTTFTEKPPIEAPLPIFETNESPIVLPQPSNSTPSGATGVPAPAPGVIIKPRMLAGEKPPYPPPSVRAKEQGITVVEVCVNARGRVDSSKLASSSGYARLDQAAVDWVRGMRFRPGTRDGTATAMCGHQITYEWKLEDAR